MRDRIDRQITKLFRETPASSGFVPAEDRDRPRRLWDSIQRDGLRAVRARRLRRTCLCAAAGMLVLCIGSFLLSFLWDGSGVQAFKEGLTRDIRIYGDEASIEYHDDTPSEPAASLEPVHIENGTIEDVEALDIFFPIPAALPAGTVFDAADIMYINPGLADVTLVYHGPQDTPIMIRYHYGKRDMSMGVDCDDIKVYEWDGIEVTHFIHDDRAMDMFMWHIGKYMIDVHAGLDTEEARALFDDINTQAYEDWKQGN